MNIVVSKIYMKRFRRVTKSLTTMCKHLSIQLSENEGDIIKYCERIKNQEYSSDVDIVFILGGDGTVNELVNGVLAKLT